MNRPFLRTAIIAAHILWPLTVLSVALISGGPTMKCAIGALCALPWYGSIAGLVLDRAAFRASPWWAQAMALAVALAYVVANVWIFGWAACWWTP